MNDVLHVNTQPITRCLVDARHLPSLVEIILTYDFDRLVAYARDKCLFLNITFILTDAATNVARRRRFLKNKCNCRAD